MSLLRDREFLKLWAGQTISEVGSRISREGIPLTALYLLSATPTQMGILNATGSASVLLVSLAAGVLADRVRRRPVMIAADFVRAALLLTIPWAASQASLTFLHLLLVAAATGVFTVMFDVCYQAYLPSLIGKQSLLEGNRRLAMSASVAEILGPSLTGVLVQLLTAPIAILIDALSFLLSAISLIVIRRSELAPEPVEGLPSRAEIFAGARLVAAHPMLRALALRSITAYFSMGLFFSLYLLFAIRVLKMSTTQLGFTIAMGGAGAFLGAWATRKTAHLPPGRTFFGASLAMGLVNLCIPLATVFPQFGIALFGAAQFFGDAAWSLLSVSETSYRQQVTDPNTLGRVNAAMQLASRGVLPLGALAGGVLADQTSIATTLWIGGVGLLLATMWLLPVVRLSATHSTQSHL